MDVQPTRADEAYRRVTQRFAAAKREFAVLEAAHRRGDRDSRQETRTLEAIASVRDATQTFRRVVAEEHHLHTT